MKAKAYGCFNRPEFKHVFPAQDGWWLDNATRVAKLTSVPFRMAKDCQYTLSQLGQADQRCTGCQWKK